MNNAANLAPLRSVTGQVLRRKRRGYDHQRKRYYYYQDHPPQNQTSATPLYYAAMRAGIANPERFSIFDLQRILGCY